MAKNGGERGQNMGPMDKTYIPSQESSKLAAQAPKLKDIMVKHSGMEDILKVYGMNPAEKLAMTLGELEEEYKKKKESLSWKEQLDYFKIVLNISERLSQYVFMRKGVINKNENTTVSVDYNKTLDHIEKRLFGRDDFKSQERQLNAVINTIDGKPLVEIEEGVVDDQDID